METQIQPTQAELEMIRLRREEKVIKDKQAATQKQLDYENKLVAQLGSFNTNKNGEERKYNANIALYNKLCDLGVKEHVTKREYTTTITANEYITKGLNEEDILKEIVSQIQLITPWGAIGQADSQNKAEIPYELSGRFQSYTTKTIAEKILEKIAKSKRIQLEKESKESYFNNLVKELKKSSPKETEFFKSTEYHSYSYRVKGMEPGYNQDYLTIKYPNGSWVKLAMGSSSWSIKDKFDSKYIKPETKEAWLEYLSKE